MIFSDEYINASKEAMLEVFDYKSQISETDVYLSNITTSTYIRENAYNEYLNAKIDNEQKILTMLSSKLNLKESVVMLEARTSDKIKAKWTKFIEFLKGIFAKFIESMDNFFKSNKEYLEKYKDIILKKKPKADIKYSIPGNYQVGIQRMIKVECPVFNYGTFKEHLENENDENNIGLAREILSKSGENYTFDEGKSLAENFKDYFAAIDQVNGDTRTGTFDDLNFTDMYNFCYNNKQAHDINKKDMDHLAQSEKMLDQVAKEIIANQDNNKPPAQQTDTNQGGENTGNATPATGGQTGEQQQQSDNNQEEAHNNSALLISNTSSAVLSEKVDISVNSNAASQTGSTNGNLDKETANKALDGLAKRDGDESTADTNNRISKMIQKWTDVCRALCTAKITIYDQITNDYMEIIRAHVRSYGGKDLKNKDDDKVQQQATDYKKPEKNTEEQQSTDENK